MASKFYNREGVTVETVDPYHAASLEAQGFKEVDAPTGAPAEEKTEAAKPLSKMTADELRAYAAEHGIGLGDATKKGDVLAAIKAAEGDADLLGDAAEGDDDPL